jgi:hypothetical protein
MASRGAPPQGLSQQSVDDLTMRIEVRARPDSGGLRKATLRGRGRVGSRAAGARSRQPPQRGSRARLAWRSRAFRGAQRERRVP